MDHLTARKRLETIAELATALAVGWPAYQATEAALALPLLRSGGGDHRGSDVPDPTAAIASSHERYLETEALTVEALGILRAIQERQANVRRHHSDLAADVDRLAIDLRCTGVVGDDPTCLRNSVREVMHNGRVEPTCWACIKRRQRADLAADPPLSILPTSDCGHVCCTQRANPLHKHWRPVTECVDCITAESEAS